MRRKKLGLSNEGGGNWVEEIGVVMGREVKIGGVDGEKECDEGRKGDVGER
jgi:hypothetical protein